VGIRTRTSGVELAERQRADSIAALVRQLLELLGEDPRREGLRRTPRRVERALRHLTSGYQKDPEKVIRAATYEVGYDEMVIVKDIDLFSLCEHHLLPFFGVCHIGYIPDRKVIGLSKLPRLVNLYARRLQLQERLTTQIAQAIWETLEPKGVGVLIEAQHFCMMMRGVEKRHSRTVTSALLGSFRERAQTRQEFLTLVGAGRKG